jgi:hypothetical protein
MALAGQHAPAGLARATMCAQGSDLRRHELRLQCCRELLGFVQPQPELGQADLLVTFDAGELGLGGHARLKFRDHHHPPHQLRHQPTLTL